MNAKTRRHEEDKTVDHEWALMGTDKEKQHGGIRFDDCGFARLNPVMIVTVDEKSRVALPQPAKPGDAFDVCPSGEDGFVLKRVNTSPGLVRLQRKDGYLVAITEAEITGEMTRRALDEFP